MKGRKKARTSEIVLLHCKRRHSASNHSGLRNLIGEVEPRKKIRNPRFKAQRDVAKRQLAELG